MLPLALLGVFTLKGFFVPWEPKLRKLDFGFGRGVKGLAVDERLVMAVVEPVGSARLPFGGVGGLPVDGFKEISLVSFSRGLRNIASGGESRHTPSVYRVEGVVTTENEVLAGISRHRFYA